MPGSPAGPNRAWTRLPSGRRLDLINPDPQAWTDQDLAIRLSRTYRWAGESCWPRSLSVAQHSLLVLALVEASSPVPLSPARRLRELLHDAEEGLIGFDCLGPLKRALGEPFQWTSQRLVKAVFRRYRLPEWRAEEHRVHKAADRSAAAAEAVHCVGWSVEEVRSVLDIDAEIPRFDPLARKYDCTPWEPWSAEDAAAAFLAELTALQQELG